MTPEPGTLGASIRIFLADGSADGVWVVEKSNWTGKALAAPRSRYAELKARADLAGPGVYVLIGPTESGVPATRVYIGETDDLAERLDSHQRRKTFWTRAVVFTSKDDNLNKAHTRYLEYRLLQLAAAAQRAELDNANAGGIPTLSEPDTAEAEAFLREMLLIYPVLGVSAFTPPDAGAPQVGSRLSIQGPEAQAEGNEVADGFVVYSGARARRAVTPSLHRYIVDIRNELVAKGVLVSTDEASYRLTRDYVFPSPSQAAMVVLGRAASGRREWRDADGVALRELQAAQAGGGEPFGED